MPNSENSISCTINNTLTNLSSGNITFTIAPETGYALPTSSSDIIITNGTLVSYDNTTGVVVINGNSTTTVSCTCPLVANE